MAQAQVKTAKKFAPYALGAALVVGGVWLWTVLSKPKADFKDLIAEYWSRVGGTEFTGLPGSLLPVIDGSEFGGTIKFKHQGPGGNYTVGFYADIEGYECWAGPVAIEIEEDDEWREYTVEVSSPSMDTRNLDHCRRIGTRKEIQSEGGDIALDDDDDACYHVIDHAEVKDLVVEEYWSQIGDQRIAGLPGAKVPITDGAEFGCTVFFRYRYLGGTFTARADLNVGENYEVAQSGEFSLPTVHDWAEVRADLFGTSSFDRHNLSHCRLIDTLKALYQEDVMVISDWDRDCYHVVTATEMRNYVVEEYWSMVDGVKFAGLPAAKVPITDGATFGAKVSFDHRYIGGSFVARIKLNVEGIYELAEATFELPYNQEWANYTVELTSISPFDRHGLAHCRLIDVLKEIDYA